MRSMRARALLLPLLLLMVPACTGFRTVRPDVFRSPQPGEYQLARQIEEHGIRTVVCLRGKSDQSSASERAAFGAGAAFESVPMSANRPPRPDTLLELWRIAGEATRPLLLHCRAGVDRTGLAAAIVVLHDTNDLALARSQLALVPNGHLSWFSAGAMDDVLDQYEPHAKEMTFREWVETVYAPQFAARQ